MSSLVKRLRYHNNKKTFRKYLTNALFKETIDNVEAGNNKYIQIPNKKSINNVEKYAFSSLGLMRRPLKCIIIPNNIKSLGEFAFADSKLEIVNIPKSIEVIKSYAFNDCENLKYVLFSYGVKQLGDGAFNTCKSLTHIQLPDSVTNIGKYLCSECYNLSSVHISNKVEAICVGTFYMCENLSSINIPDSVLAIQTNAFDFCHNLKEVKISKNTHSICKRSFQHCKNIEVIVFPKKIESKAKRIFKDLYSSDTDFTITYI